MNLVPHWQYLKYVLLHKLYVLQECLEYGLWWQAIIHDWSKFTPAEWFPYVTKFYGGYPFPVDYRPHGQEILEYQQRTSAAFKVAWLHHIHHNPHHWQHWCFLDERGANPLPMPDKYRKEMLADWRAASRANKGFDDSRQWYLDTRDNMQLHPDTRAWVERELGV